MTSSSIAIITANFILQGLSVDGNPLKAESLVLQDQTLVHLL